MNLEEIKKKVSESYDLLPIGYKKRAADIHGVTPNYFQRIVKGEPDDEDVYHSAFNAIKQAASEAFKESERIKDIMVKSEEVK